MFDIDRWQEIFDTISKNKLRTFLTGLSVASGIFILVILLGFGQGMENGIRKEFEGDATNLIYIWSRTTTKEYKGLNPGRRITLNNENYDHIVAAQAENLEYKSGVYRVPFGTTVNYKNESMTYGVWGVHPNYQQIENESLVMGRYVDEMDINDQSKVAVISYKIQQEMLKDVENPLEEFLQISGINFKIIGVYTDPAGDREEDRVFIPFSTAQSVFNGADRISNLGFTMKPAKNFETALKESKRFEAEIVQYLKETHTISPDDQRAIGVNNVIEDTKRFYNLTNSIAMFFWFVGICTIIAGVVGVSNIMMIIVKERTREIGIRKALGAKPWSIIGMIMQESIFVTAVSGFGGLIFSMALLEIVGPNVEVDYVLNPSVNFSIAMTMVILLILAGGLAGFFPAWRAANIHPIEALKDE